MNVFSDGTPVSDSGAIDGVVPAALQPWPSGTSFHKCSPLSDDTLACHSYGGPIDEMAVYFYNRRTAFFGRCAWQPLGIRTIARLCAGGGLIAVQSQAGVEVSDGREFPTAVLHDVTPDGDLLLGSAVDASGAMVPGNADTAFACMPGLTTPYLTIPGAWKLQMTSRVEGAWMDGQFRWHGIGIPDLPFGGNLVRLADGRTFCDWGAIGVALYEVTADGSTVGLLADQTPHDFDQVALVTGPTEITIACSYGAGELIGEQRVYVIDVGPVGTPPSFWTLLARGAGFTPTLTPIAPVRVGDLLADPNAGYDLAAICAAIRALPLPNPCYQMAWLDTFAPFDAGGHGATVGGIRAIRSPMNTVELHMGARWQDMVGPPKWVIAGHVEALTVPQAYLRGLLGSLESADQYDTPEKQAACLVGVGGLLALAKARGVPAVVNVDAVSLGEPRAEWLRTGLSSLEGTGGEIVPVLELYPKPGWDEAATEAAWTVSRDAMLATFRRVGYVRSLYTQSGRFTVAEIVRRALPAHRVVCGTPAGRLYVDGVAFVLRPSGIESYPSEFRPLEQAVADSNPDGALPTLMTTLPFPGQEADDMPRPLLTEVTVIPVRDAIAPLVLALYRSAPLTDLDDARRRTLEAINFLQRNIGRRPSALQVLQVLPLTLGPPRSDARPDATLIDQALGADRL